MSGPAPLTVTVSGETSTATDGTIASYAWDFGDNSRGTGARAEHTYAIAGTYVITLEVTDQKGRSGSVTARAVAIGPEAVYDASVYDGASFRDEPASGTYDATTLQ
jgi:PKD repeat protein